MKFKSGKRKFWKIQKRGDIYARGMASCYAAGRALIREINQAEREKLLTENAATSPATSPSEALLTVNRPGRSQRAATPSKPLTTGGQA